ncbi:E3 ubiquitin-protein ligase TRIM33-like [Saccostrea cucullata]|uniref:E3 ubiquitin-protein ligase TRIM33-like n=1 Tax=Saccostrea cuccullata TaxID=36930 RepID=UPI002ED02315
MADTYHNNLWSTTLDQVPDTAQHFIECDTEFCRNFSEFYCNTCHQRMCVQCEHVHRKKNKSHTIIPYHERKRKLPSEICRIHPTKDIDVYCEDCQDPVCSMCFAKDHSDHVYSDLEAIYNDTLHKCQKEITEIWKTVIPEAKNNVESIGKKRENVIKEFAEFRVSMKKRAYELKKAVDSILTDDNKKLDEIENSVLNDIEEQQKETESYIKYLEKIISDYESKMSSIKYTELRKFLLDNSSATLKMLNKATPKLLILTLGKLNKQEIANQFGEIELQSSERFELSPITKVSEVTTQVYAYHLSPSPSWANRFWGSGWSGNLIQYDMEGNIRQKIPNSISYLQGNHTVTSEGELLYTDYRKNTVYRVTSDKSINKLIETGSWEPGAIYSSPINGHILVGMGKKSDQKITRYDREGRKLQDIQWDDKGQNLYQSVNFIVENNNSDICVSDVCARKVVVVTASGEYRFSYSGHHSQSGFRPYGICTDVLGHILVCNGYMYQSCNENCSSVHLLDIDGHFLSFLLTPNHFLSLLLSSEQCPLRPCALCIDDHHNLWVGGWESPTVSVYKYLQKTEKK